ncbi:MAG: hypothetical protein VCE75_22370 [Alphaproteobacteria bacterium]
MPTQNVGEDWAWLKSAIEHLEMNEHERLVSELEQILDSDQSIINVAWHCAALVPIIAMSVYNIYRKQRISA